MSNDVDLAELAAQLAHHQLQVPAAQRGLVCDYARRLWQWNENINLTRHTSWDLLVGRDIRDTLQLSALLKPGEQVLDVGSGGGVPGLLLAILRPDLDVSLAESVAKKAKVLADITAGLGVQAAVHHARAEDLLEDLRFHSVVARAVGPLWKLCKWFEPHWASMDRLLLIKGPKWPEERGEARHRGLLAKLQLRCVASYDTPGADGQSVILQLWPTGRDMPS